MMLILFYFKGAFKTMKMFHKSINNMAQQLENEKNRVKQYQSDTKQSTDRFHNDFS